VDVSVSRIRMPVLLLRVCLEVALEIQLRRHRRDLARALRNKEIEMQEWMVGQREDQDSIWSYVGN